MVAASAAIAFMSTGASHRKIASFQEVSISSPAKLLGLNLQSRSARSFSSLGIYGQPEEVVGLVEFLALNPTAAYITAQVKMDKPILTLDKGTRCTTWNYSGQRLVSGLVDGTLVTYDLTDPASATFTCTSRIKARESSILKVAGFSPNTVMQLLALVKMEFCLCGRRSLKISRGITGRCADALIETQVKF